MKMSQLLNAQKEYELTKKRVEKYNREVLKNFRKVTPYHFRKFQEDFNGYIGLDENKVEFIYNGNTYTVRFVAGRLHLDNMVMVWIEDRYYPIIMD